WVHTGIRYAAKTTAACQRDTGGALTISKLFMYNRFRLRVVEHPNESARLQMKTVFMTGAAGVIGRAVCTELANRGHRVRAFDRIQGSFDCDWTVADLADREALRAAATG